MQEIWNEELYPLPKSSPCRNCPCKACSPNYYQEMHNMACVVCKKLGQHPAAGRKSRKNLRMGISS